MTTRPDPDRYALTEKEAAELGGMIHEPTGHYIPRLSGDGSSVYVSKEYLAMLAADYHHKGVPKGVATRALEALELKKYEWVPHVQFPACNVCGAKYQMHVVVVWRDGHWTLDLPVTITHAQERHSASVTAGPPITAEDRMSRAATTATSLMEDLL